MGDDLAGKHSIEELLAYWHEKLLDIPEAVHLLCPKLDDNDPVNYDEPDEPDLIISREEKTRRIEEANERIRVAYWNSLIFGYDREKAGSWLEEVVIKLQTCLSKCEKCVKGWHMHRKKFLNEFSERWNEDAIDHMDYCLNRFDFARIDLCFRWAISTIDSCATEGQPFKRSALGERLPQVLLAVFESLCCMPFLSVPENRQAFHRVFTALQLKKPLRLGAKVLLPAMTTFLFEPVANRARFAQEAWAQIDSGGLTEQQWDWAVGDNLAAAIKDVSQFDSRDPDSHESIERFWDGVLQILRTMGDSLVTHRLRAMDVKPSLYDLLLIHVSCESETVLLKVIRALAALVQTSPKAFWDNFTDPRPFVVAEQILRQPLYKTLLNESFNIFYSEEGQRRAGDSSSQTQVHIKLAPSTISWISVWLESLDWARTHDACESLLHTLFEGLYPDPELTNHGQAACLRAAMDGLLITLRSFIKPVGSLQVTAAAEGVSTITSKAVTTTSALNSNTGLLYINSSLNLLMKYIDRIIVNVEPTDFFAQWSLANTAIALVRGALDLDARAICEERRALMRGTPVQQTVVRDSSALWSAFLPLLESRTYEERRVDVARAMLSALMPMSSIEKILPQRKDDLLSLGEPERLFNARFDRTSEAIAAVFLQLSEYGPAELNSLRDEYNSLHAIFTYALNGQPEVSQAAWSLIKTISCEERRLDALRDILKNAFRVGISSLTAAIRAVNRDPWPWSPMAQLLPTCRDLIDCLCDPVSGILRTRILTGHELNATMSWWICQWKCVKVAFHNTELWARTIDTPAMIDFCREVMDWADVLLMYDGVIASTLRRGMPGEAKEKETMHRVLRPVCDCLSAIVHMLRLRDPYLIGKLVQILVRVFGRLLECGLQIDDKVLSYVKNACFRGNESKLAVGTILNRRQRADLLEALGEEADEDEEAPVIVAVRPQKQSTLETWTSGAAVLPPLIQRSPASLARLAAERSSRNDAKELGRFNQDDNVMDLTRSNQDDDVVDLTQSNQDDDVMDLTRSNQDDDVMDLTRPNQDDDVMDCTQFNQDDDVLDLTPSSNQLSGSTLDMMRARQPTPLPAMTAARLPSLKPNSKPASDQAAIKAKQMALREARQKEKDETAKRNAEVVAKAKALRIARAKFRADDGFSSDDNLGKSRDDDDADGNEGTTMLAQYLKRNAAAIKEFETTKKKRRRGTLAAQAQMPVKKEKVARSAKDMRARVNPSMAKLHQEILEWDIFHDQEDPPNAWDCVRVADTFSTHDQYRRTFYPLLMHEAWRSFVTDKGETISKPTGIRVATRMNVDSFLEMTATMPVMHHEQQQGDKDKEKLPSEGDILLLSQSDNPLSDYVAKHCLARVCRIQHKKDQIELTYRLSQRNNKLAAMLKPGVDVYAVRITNMATIEREFAALESLQYCELRQEVLGAIPAPALKFGAGRVNNIGALYALNSAQARAVLCAAHNDGFTLVQGPPGTGKTKTIVAMVGALLTKTLRKSAETAAAVPLPVPVSVRNSAGRANNVAPTPRKLLICAPSNAAVDELVLRLKQGVVTMDGKSHKVKVLRLGRTDAINQAVKDVTLDELVRQRLEGDDTREKSKLERERMHEDAGRIKHQLLEARARFEAANQVADVTEADTAHRDVIRLKREQAQVGARIDALKASGTTVQREVELKRRAVEQEFLNTAEVLCATLSGSGHDMFKNLNIEFETVIIDEAAQCVELSALIPLKYGCLKCVLVGDPKQLPPTVLSQSAARFGYGQSLFVRMQRNRPEDVHLLDRQYRMHPEISLFPSREFYEEKLIDGNDMADLRTRSWHTASALLGPYRFFDVSGTQEQGNKGQSLVNMVEVRAAAQLYDLFLAKMRRASGNNADEAKVGIITPYKAQLQRLRSHFRSRYGPGITGEVEFNTTDAFQGRECDVIIFSCVRASSTGGIGFMTDIRRMNVGLTRAKSSLWILGNSKALMQGEYWRKLIEDSQKRKLYTDGDVFAALKKDGEKKANRAASRVVDGNAKADIESSVDVCASEVAASRVDYGNAEADIESSVDVCASELAVSRIDDGNAKGTRKNADTRVDGGNVKETRKNADTRVSDISRVDDGNAKETVKTADTRASNVSRVDDGNAEETVKNADTRASDVNRVDDGNAKETEKKADTRASDVSPVDDGNAKGDTGKKADTRASDVSRVDDGNAKEIEKKADTRASDVSPLDDGNAKGDTGGKAGTHASDVSPVHDGNAKGDTEKKADTRTSDAGPVDGGNAKGDIEKKVEVCTSDVSRVVDRNAKEDAERKVETWASDVSPVVDNNAEENTDVSEVMSQGQQQHQDRSQQTPQKASGDDGKSSSKQPEKTEQQQPVPTKQKQAVLSASPTVSTLTVLTKQADVPQQIHRSQSIGGINERGEAVPVPPQGLGAPVIKTSTAGKTTSTSGRKRAQEEWDRPEATKRVCEHFINVENCECESELRELESYEREKNQRRRISECDDAIRVYEIAKRQYLEHDDVEHVVYNKQESLGPETIEHEVHKHDGLGPSLLKRESSVSSVSLAEHAVFHKLAVPAKSSRASMSHAPFELRRYMQWLDRLHNKPFNSSPDMFSNTISLTGRDATSQVHIGSTQPDLYEETTIEPRCSVAAAIVVGVLDETTRTEGPVSLAGPWSDSSRATASGLESIHTLEHDFDSGSKAVRQHEPGRTKRNGIWAKEAAGFVGSASSESPQEAQPVHQTEALDAHDPSHAQLSDDDLGSNLSEQNWIPAELHVQSPLADLRGSLPVEVQVCQDSDDNYNYDTDTDDDDTDANYDDEDNDKDDRDGYEFIVDSERRTEDGYTAQDETQATEWNVSEADTENSMNCDGVMW